MPRGIWGDVMSEPYLQLHLEPSEHIEVSELTGALTALARQYQTFAVQNALVKKTSDARLLVSSVAPGSIDISLYPDLVEYLAALPMLAPLIDKAELIAKFGKVLKSLFELFKKKRKAKRRATSPSKTATTLSISSGLSPTTGAAKRSTSSMAA
jgi:hypothetical protein